MQDAIVDRLKRLGRPISITGDGQFDSPGFSATFCFYSIVEAKTKMIIDFFVAEKTMAEYSAKLEPLAAKVLARLHKKRVDIRVCTTDRSSQLKKMLNDVNEVRGISIITVLVPKVHGIIFGKVIIFQFSDMS